MVFPATVKNRSPEAHLSLRSSSAARWSLSLVAVLASSRSSALSLSRLSRSRVSWSTMERGGVKDQSGASPLCRRPHKANSKLCNYVKPLGSSYVLADDSTRSCGLGDEV